MDYVICIVLYPAIFASPAWGSDSVADQVWGGKEAVATEPFLVPKDPRDGGVEGIREGREAHTHRCRSTKTARARSREHEISSHADMSPLYLYLKEWRDQVRTAPRSLV